MRFAPLFAAFTTAAGLVGFSTATGRPPDKAAKADPDLERFQGDWLVTGLDVPPGENAVPPDDLKRVVLSVRGTLVTTRVTGPDGKAENPTYDLIALDSSKTPRELNVTKADEKGRPRPGYKTDKATGKVVDDEPPPPTRAIYKFEGEKLVICFGDGDPVPRPTEFKARWSREPRDRPPYFVVHLSKKK